MPNLELHTRPARRKVLSLSATTVNDKARLLPYSSPLQYASANGLAYRVTTGTIALSNGAVESACLYFKSDEDVPIVFHSLYIGVGIIGATVTDHPKVTILKNPTAGTIVSGASVATVTNVAFGSSSTLEAGTLAYKGAQGNTFTDGDDFDFFFMDEGASVDVPLELSVANGDSVGVKVLLNTSGAANVILSALIYQRGLDLL